MPPNIYSEPHLQRVYPRGFSNGRWAGDLLNAEARLRVRNVLDASLFAGENGNDIIVAAAGATAGDPAIPLKRAISVEMPAKVVLHFGGGKFAVTSAIALKGDTSLAVDPATLVNDLVENDATVWSATEARSITDGLVVGRTYTERENGDLWHPVTDADDEILIIGWPVLDATVEADFQGYRPGLSIKENMLPHWQYYSDIVKGKIRATYHTILVAAYPA